MSEIIDSRNERIVRFFKSLDRMIAGVEKLSANKRIPLNGEIYLTPKIRNHFIVDSFVCSPLHFVPKNQKKLHE